MKLEDPALRDLTKVGLATALKMLKTTARDAVGSSRLLFELSVSIFYIG